MRALETTSSLKQGERPHINKGDPVNLALEPLLLEAAFCLSDAAKRSLPGVSRLRQGSPECPLPSSDWLQGGQGGASWTNGIKFWEFGCHLGKEFSRQPVEEASAQQWKAEARDGENPI